MKPFPSDALRPGMLTLGRERPPQFYPCMGVVAFIRTFEVLRLGRRVGCVCFTYIGAGCWTGIAHRGNQRMQTDRVATFREAMVNLARAWNELPATLFDDAA